jgi:predicted pyridoxine 5'-phosphate oxidase superfamily flavin-nucleotide-binding protein
MSDDNVAITDDMRDMVRRAILCFVATVNEDGTPNLSPKASLTFRGDALFFANIASPQTVWNIRRNPAVEINVVDFLARRGYRFAGRGTILGPKDEAFQDVAAWVKSTNGEIYPVFDVIRIELASIRPVLSPAYTIGGADEATLTESYRRKYGASGP